MSSHESVSFHPHGVWMLVIDEAPNRRKLNANGDAGDGWGCVADVTALRQETAAGEDDD